MPPAGAHSTARLVATHYGFYNTVVGVGILVGNLATGAVVGAARDAGSDWAVWAGLSVIGVVAASALHRLDRSEPADEKHAQTTEASGRHSLPPGDTVGTRTTGAKFEKTGRFR
ncbi:hypothetical protein [Nocardia abscessus]|uniref:hypothetical protein n=1 Tax=Nocardia abscessus TaxID=120957 RepID=UPI003CC7EBD5